MRENVFPNTGFSSPGYHIAGRSNVIATPPAGTDALGHLVAYRNPSARLVLLTKVKVILTIVSPPTAAQELGFSVFKATGYTASHTGGLAMSAFAKGLAATPASDAPQAADMRIADTAALTDGTHAALTLLIGSVSRLYAAAAATVLNEEQRYEWAIPDGKAIALSTDQGIIVPNLVLGGAGSSVRVHFEADEHRV